MNNIYITVYKNPKGRLEPLFNHFKTRQITLVAQTGDDSYNDVTLPENFKLIKVNATNLSQKREQIRLLEGDNRYWVFDDDLDFCVSFEGKKHRVSIEDAIAEVEQNIPDNFQIFSFSGDLTVFQLGHTLGYNLFDKRKSGCSNFFYNGKELNKVFTGFLPDRYYREDKYAYLFCTETYISLKYAVQFSPTAIADTNTTTIWTSDDVYKKYAIGNIILTKNKLHNRKKKNGVDYQFNRGNNTNQLHWLYQKLVVEDKTFDEIKDDFIKFVIEHKRFKCAFSINWEKLHEAYENKIERR